MLQVINQLQNPQPTTTSIEVQELQAQVNTINTQILRINASITAINSQLNSYYTSSQITTLLNNKQNLITSGSLVLTQLSVDLQAKINSITTTPPLSTISIPAINQNLASR